jgi:spermidine synthase
VIEIGVAAAALIFPWLLRALDPVFGATYRALGADSAVFAFLRFLYVFALLMIPTTLMGATLPLLSRFLARSRETLGSRIGALYAINTTERLSEPSARDSSCSPRWACARRFGSRPAMNLLVGAAASGSPAASARRLPRRKRSLPRRRAPPESAAPEPSGGGGAAAPGSLLLFPSGAVALAYQVVWTRALVFSFEMMKNTTYAFSGMLTVFLIGLALGSALMTAAVDASAIRCASTRCFRRSSDFRARSPTS